MPATEGSLAGLMQERKLHEVIRTLSLAQMRCLTTRELIDRIPQIAYDNDREEIIWCLSETEITEAEAALLAANLQELGACGDSVPSKDRQRIDKLIARLARLLPETTAVEFAKTSLQHRRKSRREVTYSVFRRVGVPSELAAYLLARHRETGDAMLLQLATRNPVALSDDDAVYLLGKLEEHYWRMRVIHSLLDTDPARALRFAGDYPREFVHAVGRSKNADMLGKLLSLHEHHKQDLDFVDLFAWALGKLGQRDLLEQLRKDMVGQLPSC